MWVEDGHGAEQRSLPPENSDQAIFGTQTFGSQTPPPPSSPLTVACSYIQITDTGHARKKRSRSRSPIAPGRHDAEDSSRPRQLGLRRGPQLRLSARPIAPPFPCRSNCTSSTAFSRKRRCTIGTGWSRLKRAGVCLCPRGGPCLRRGPGAPTPAVGTAAAVTRSSVTCVVCGMSVRRASAASGG